MDQLDIAFVATDTGQGIFDPEEAKDCFVLTLVQAGVKPVQPRHAPHPSPEIALTRPSRWKARAAAKKAVTSMSAGPCRRNTDSAQGGAIPITLMRRMASVRPVPWRHMKPIPIRLTTAS